MKPILNPLLYEDLIHTALAEDLGLAGDITTDSIVPPETKGSARLFARAEGCLAGVEIAAAVFLRIDSELEVEILKQDGEVVGPGEEILVVQGRARSLLIGERVALNFLGRLSGIATATWKVVESIGSLPTRVVCTRKTTPGLRALEKYAVRAGGGSNHRFGLDDAVLIKENHLAIAGSVREAVERARAHAGHLVRIEVEVENLEQLEEALAAKADAVLLDNMTVEEVREAVRRVGGSILTEVSGGITPERAAALAATGVDLMSIGWLTHSAPALDLSLDITVGGRD